MTQQETFYSKLDNIRARLFNIKDMTQDNSITMRQRYIDSYINRKLKEKLGNFLSNGNPVILPLTNLTIPKLDPDMQAQADDLVIALYRRDTSGKERDIDEWEKARRYFEEEFLVSLFGMTSAKGYTVFVNIILSPYTGPVGTIVTITGQNYRQFATLLFFLDGIPVPTSPAEVITDSLGNFTCTLTIPTGTQSGTHFVKVLDGDGTILDANNNPVPINGSMADFQVP